MLISAINCLSCHSQLGGWQQYGKYLLSCDHILTYMYPVATCTCRILIVDLGYNNDDIKGPKASRRHKFIKLGSL